MTAAPTLSTLNYMPEAVDLLVDNPSGLLLVGTPNGHGRTAIAHALALTSVAAHGGHVASVNNGETYTSHAGINATNISVNNSHDALRYAALDGARTIVVDVPLTNIATAHAVTLARSGWCVIVALDEPDLLSMLDSIVEQQRTACYSTLPDGTLLAAEDVAAALIGITSQEILHDRPGKAAVRVLPIEDEERLQIVSRFTVTEAPAL